MAQGLRVFGVGDLIMIFNMGRRWPSHRGKLLDAAAMGHSMSLSVGGGERGCWPPFAGELWDAASGASSESLPVVDHRI